jgi:hypothetical protein
MQIPFMSITVTPLFRYKNWNVYISSLLTTQNGLSKLWQKRSLNFLLVILFSFAFSTVQGQTKYQITKALKLLEENPEVYLSISAEMFNSELASRASLDYFSNKRAFLYVNKYAMGYIIDNEIDFRLELSPGSVDFELNMLGKEELLQKDLTESWDFYPTYDAYVALMYKFETDYPELVEIHQIGTSVQGRALLFARIGPNIESERAVPRFMYTSTIHGDETTGFVLSLRLIYHLISNYGIDDEISSLMDQVEIWICPNENPDGTYTNNNETVSGATRSNANGKDLNRNYPVIHPSYTFPPETPIQPETQAMIDFMGTRNFVMSANMHGGIELVNYPFDAWVSAEKLHADNEWWKLVSQEYADTVHAYSPSGYFTGQGDGVTHGGDWYVVYGSRQDYMNYFHSCREFTLELSDQKLLSPNKLPDHWDFNYRSLINYIRQATYGFHGFVKDSATELPVFATLELTGHDSYNSQVTSSLSHGGFSRPVFAGMYDLTFTAEGYPSVSMPGLSISNYERINLNVYLGSDSHPLYVYAADGSMGKVAGAGIYPVGYNVTIQAIPEVGYVFLHWQNESGQIIDEASELSFQMMDGSTTFRAVFVEGPPEYAVYFSTGTGEGLVKAFIDDEYLQSGTLAKVGSDILFVATPERGYKVDSWISNGLLIPDYTSDEYLLKKLNTTINLETNFSLVEYLLTVNLSDENSGDVVILPDSETFTFGQTVNLTAVPKPGFMFDFWKDGDGNMLSHYDSYSFSMPDHDLEITAVFAVLAAISDVGVYSHIRVFPNPTHNQLTIETDFKMHSLEIIDENGRLMLSTSIASGNTAQITLSGINRGFYFLRVNGEFGPVIRKLQVL